MGWSRRGVGLTYYDPGRAYPGYTLLNVSGGDKVYLIDLEGSIVHQWHYAHGFGECHLLPSGHLLFRSARSTDRGGFPGLPVSDTVGELGWEGEVVWEHHNPNIRRYSRLPNGNTMLLLSEQISAEKTRQVQGGYATSSDPERMLGDLVVEVTPEGSLVYEWRSADHLDPETDIICPLENRVAWGGANDFTALEDGSFLISFRILDTVALVDRNTGEFSWKWGRGQISHQHNPTRLANSHVLLLDNGSHRRGLSYSRVVEVDIDTSEIAWEYHGEPLTSFFTHFTGGAERLPNGNTLICEGSEGRLFEVTPGSEVAWEYISPLFLPDPQGYGNRVFRTHRYGPDCPGLTGRDLDPARYANLNRIYAG